MRHLALTAALVAVLAFTHPAGARAAPLAFCLTENNEPFSAVGPARGIDFDLAHRLAARLGRQAHIEWLAAGEEHSPEAALRAGRCDVALGAIVDPGMAQHQAVPGLALTRPYYAAGYRLIHRPGTPSPRRLAELGDTRIAVEMVSIPIYTLKQRGRRVYALDSSEAVLRAVADGRAQYGYVWGPLIATMLKQRKDVVLSPSFAPVERWEFALAVREEDTELHAALDSALGELTAQGEIAQLFAAHGIPYLPPADSGADR